MSKPMRFSLKHYGQMSCVEHCPEGEYVLHSDYARLKAEVEAYRSASDEVAAAFLALPAPHNQVGRVCEGIDRLKAEVERLNVVIGLEQKTIRNLQQTPEWSEITRLTAYCRDLQAEVGRLRASSFVTAVPVEEYEKLKAEVERLRKAGDAMAKRTEFFQKRWDVDELCQEVEAWNAAKKGKQP